MATADEVERAIRSLAKSLADASPEPTSIPERTILCVVSDLDAAYWAELKGARLKGLKAADPTAQTDVRITARSDDLISLIQGKLSIGNAFLTGRVRIDASARDLMMLRRLF